MEKNMWASRIVTSLKWKIGCHDFLLVGVGVESPARYKNTSISPTESTLREPMIQSMSANRTNLPIISSINHFIYKILENCDPPPHYLLKPKVIPINCLFCPTDNPKLKNMNYNIRQVHLRNCCKNPKYIWFIFDWSINSFSSNSESSKGICEKPVNIIRWLLEHYQTLLDWLWRNVQWGDKEHLSYRCGRVSCTC